MGKTKRGYALLLGAGTSFLLVLAGVLLALLYVLFSSKGTYYLSSYFTCVFFVSVFCGGYVAGQKGGIRSWVPAGLIGFCTGGLLLVLLSALFSTGPGIRELFSLLLIPTLLSSTGSLVASNKIVRRQGGHGNDSAVY